MTDATRRSSGGAAVYLADWLRRLGPLAARRPPPSVGRAVAAAGGSLVALGVVAIGGDRWASSGSSGLAIVLTGALLVASLVAVVRLPPLMGVAGVAASGLASPALAFFILSGGGFPSLRGVALLAGVPLAGLYLVGPWKGHTFHLAILVVAVWVLALSLGRFTLQRDLGGFGTLGEIVSGAGAASMVLGVVYLGLGSWLHDEGLEGMATPVLAVAALALPIGAQAVVRDGADPLGGMILLLIGAAVVFVGGRCRRRGTTWIGAGVAAVGVISLASGIVDGTSAVAVVVAVAGAGLVALAPWAAALLGEPAAPPADGPDSAPTAGFPEAGR